MSMKTAVKITATVSTNDQGYESEPVSVTVTGAGFLQASAVTDIAQEALDSSYGYRHPYLALRPDEVTDSTVVSVHKR